MRGRFCLFWMLFPVTVWANNKAGNSPSITNGELLRVMAGLLLVVGVIVFLSWLLRRVNSAGLGNTNGFKVIVSMSLGTREKIMLVNIGNRFLLLGVTSGSINTLHDFGEELPAGFLSESKTSFTEFLKTALGKS
ncbi:flagellar biosynthetic protein FliO [Legionella brunensis]|uniref:Flagellar protein n=1 Tax=Legionella brunensis TaxID=29422 RepID=A0A0W0SSS0_9GAMM|nr:flagellar biosynthetic protein FliO [Legionella brunensis]KTC86408.1 flagellar protein fliO [Legionella brunensis]